MVSEGTEQQEQDQDIELNGVETMHENEEPLISVATGPGLREALPFESSTESFDPLYERVRHSATVNVEPDRPTEEEVEGPKPEPVYSQVDYFVSTKIEKSVHLLREMLPVRFFSARLSIDMYLGFE